MVIRCWRAVLGKGSKLGNGPNPEYPPWCDENCSDIGGGGMLLNHKLNGGKSAVFISKDQWWAKYTDQVLE